MIECLLILTTEIFIIEVNCEVMYMMDNTSENERCYVSFVISGLELDPDEISKLLGIRPDHSHRKGDVKQLIDKAK
jgi:hypothetical protein